jgi:hypothetical protein
MTVATTTKPHPWLAEIARGRADAEAGHTKDFDAYIAKCEAEDNAVTPDMPQDGPAPGL